MEFDLGEKKLVRLGKTGSKDALKVSEEIVIGTANKEANARIRAAIGDEQPLETRDRALKSESVCRSPVLVRLSKREYNKSIALVTSVGLSCVSAGRISNSYVRGVGGSGVGRSAGSDVDGNRERVSG